jgi:hypothetical protein
MIVQFKRNPGANRKLYVVCPFSFTESLLREKYGDEDYFLSCNGAVLSYSDSAYLQAIGDLLIREEIRTICFVQDTSCRFLNGAIRKSVQFGLNAESLMGEIFAEQCEPRIEGMPLWDKQRMLADLVIKSQVQALLQSEELGGLALSRRIEVMGMITSRERKVFEEVPMYRTQRMIHER